MTHVSTLRGPRTGLSAGSPSASDDDRRKAVLFCECGREAAPDSWRVEVGADGDRLVCPDCGETLTVR
jgi:hypothetical protein